MGSLFFSSVPRVRRSKQLSPQELSKVHMDRSEQLEEPGLRFEEFFWFWGGIDEMFWEFGEVLIGEVLKSMWKFGGVYGLGSLVAWRSCCLFGFWFCHLFSFWRG